jgi:hypothetical protein
MRDRFWSPYPDSKVPSLFALQRIGGGWVWAIYDFCCHRRPLALAPYTIRWGMKASSNKLRRSLHCICGRKGATIQGPGWVNSIIGAEPFPVDYRCACDACKAQRASPMRHIWRR